LNLGLPADLTWYKLLVDGGSLIGGVFALLAGAAAYLAGWLQARATRQAADRQIAAAARKDRLQARCIAVGISPELLALEVAHERAYKTISEEFPRAKIAQPALLTIQIVALIRSVQIAIPPLLSRNVDQLYILEDAGPSLLQLVSITLQYNQMVSTLAEQISQRIDDFNPQAHQKDLFGHLHGIAQLLSESQQHIAPIYAEVMAETAQSV
jgi:hypothetical protein